MASIKELPTKAGRFERIGAHTHMKGTDQSLRFKPKAMSTLPSYAETLNDVIPELRSKA